MDWFIHEQNLAHYSKVLSETTNPTKRQILLRLLANERRKWNEIDAQRIDWRDREAINPH